jgi:predicted alpha/beta superfamily hydrolase
MARGRIRIAPFLRLEALSFPHGTQALNGMWVRACAICSAWVPITSTSSLAYWILRQTSTFGLRRRELTMHRTNSRIGWPAVALLIFLAAPALVCAADDGDDVSMTVARSYTIESTILGEERQVLVNLPGGYADNQTRYPVLIVLDGSPFMIFHATASLTDRSIPEFVVASVPNVDRLRDMSHQNVAEIWPTSGGAERFLSFLTDELVPWLDAEFRTTGYRVIIGGSAAGRFAAFALLKAPAVFDAAISRSPAVGTDFEMFRELVASASAASVPGDHFLYIVYGSHDYPVVTIYVERLLRLLEDESPPWLRYEREVLDNKGHFQFSSVNAGLSALFADYRFPSERFLVEGPATVAERARMLSARFKTDVEASALTSESELVDSACDLGRQRRFTDAIKVLDYGLELHPDSSRMVYYLAQMLEHADRTEEAVAAYTRVFEMEPSTGIAGMTQVLLDNLIETTRSANSETGS